MKRRLVSSFRELRAAAVALALALLCFFVPTSHAQTPPWALGNVTTGSLNDAQRPTGYTSNSFTVTTPGSSRLGRGFYTIKNGVGTPKGMAVFFAGAHGYNYYIGSNSKLNAMADDLVSQGYTIVQVRWTEGESVFFAAPLEQTGVGHLMSRSAAVIKHIYDTKYLFLNPVPPKVIGKTGFCLVGNSGGATQICFALSNYGLDYIVDVVVATGGPIHTALYKCVFPTPAEVTAGYQMGTLALDLLDKSWGFFDGSGPAMNKDTSPAWKTKWVAEGIATSLGNDFYHPQTRVEFIIGAGDQTNGKATYKDHYDALVNAGSPYVTAQTGVQDMEHNVGQTQEGVDAVKAAILKTVSGGDTVAPPRPSLVAPANGSTTADNTPRFDWTDVPDPSGVTYQLQVDNNSNFSSPNIDASGLSISEHTPSTNLPNGTYYWRVRAIDGASNVSAWTASRTVTLN